MTERHDDWDYLPKSWYVPEKPEGTCITIFIAGAVPDVERLGSKLTKLCVNYDRVVLIADKGNTPMLHALEYAPLDMKFSVTDAEMGTFPGWMEFMGPDGDKAALVFYKNEGYSGDMAMARTLSKEEGVQYREIAA